jgi:SET domain
MVLILLVVRGTRVDAFRHFVTSHQARHAALRVSTDMQGTALYSLQSCLNHADDPGASALKGDDDVDGRAVLSAARDITAGEELCISYIDLDASDRSAVLRDYGVHVHAAPAAT